MLTGSSVSALPKLTDRQILYRGDLYCRGRLFRTLKEVGRWSGATRHFGCRARLKWNFGGNGGMSLPDDNLRLFHEQRGGDVAGRACARRCGAAGAACLQQKSAGEGSQGFGGAPGAGRRSDGFIPVNMYDVVIDKRTSRKQPTTASASDAGSPFSGITVRNMLRGVKGMDGKIYARS